MNTHSEEINLTFMETNARMHLKTNEKALPMKNIHIPEPCGENFQQMPATERGAYCAKCATDTFDFKGKTTEEIKGILMSQMGKKVCGQFTTNQLQELNEEFEAWTFTSTKSFQSGFLFALIAVFGLTLFSCTEQQQEADIISFQETTKTIMDNMNPENIATLAESDSSTANVSPDISIDYIGYDMIGGVIGYDWVEEKRIEPIEIIEPEILEYAIAGGISYTNVYADYITATVVDEYDEEGRVIPKEYSSLTFPNPTSSTSTLEIKVPKKGDFKIDLYDLNGQYLKSIYEGEIERGTFRQEYDLTDLPTGMYLVVIASKKYKETVRVSKI